MLLRIFSVFPIIFTCFGTMNAHALSDARIHQLKREWITLKKAGKVQTNFLDFLSKSKTLVRAFEDGETLTKAELTRIDSEFERFPDNLFNFAIIHPQMKAEIRAANAFRASVVELTRYFIFGTNQLEKNLMATAFENHQTEIRNKISLVMKNQEADEAQLKESLGSLQSLKYPKVQGKTTKERLNKLKNERERNKNSIAMYEGLIATYQESIENDKKEINRLNRELKKKFNPSQVQINVNVNSDSKVGSISDGMPVLRLMSANLTSAEFIAISQSIVKDLFLALEDFADFDSTSLSEQLEFSRKAIDHVSFYLSDLSEISNDEEKETARKAGFSIDKSNIISYRNLLVRLSNLFQLELRRREFIAQGLANPLSDVASNEHSGDSESDDSEEEELQSKSEDKTERLLPPSASSSEQQFPWNAILSSEVAKEIENLTQKDADLFQVLINDLKSFGPKLRPIAKGRDRRLRNYGSLGKSVFHCHLGSDQLVAVWEVTENSEAPISIFYLGRHPNDKYKKLMKARSAAAAE